MAKLRSTCLQVTQVHAIHCMTVMSDCHVQSTNKLLLVTVSSPSLSWRTGLLTQRKSTSASSNTTDFNLQAHFDQRSGLYPKCNEGSTSMISHTKIASDCIIGKYYSAVQRPCQNRTDRVSGERPSAGGPRRPAAAHAARGPHPG